MENIRKIEKLKKYESELFRSISFNKNSEYFFEITPETIQYIKENYSRSHKVRLNVEVQIKTDYKNMLIKYPFDLNEELGMLFLNMISQQKC